MARVSFDDRKSLASAIVGILPFAAIGYLVLVVLTKIGLVGQSQWFLRLGLATAIAFWVATWVVGRRLTGYSWSDLGWHRPALRHWLQGAAIGVAMAALALVLAFLSGARLIVTHEWSGWLAALVPLALGIALIALGAELTYRGYPLRRLADAVGVVPATLILAVLAALLQMRASTTTFFSTVNVLLATIWLSVAFFSAGGLPLAWGAHFGWTALLTLVNASANHLVLNIPGFVYMSAHPWLDGGISGPEAGIAGTLALFAGTLYLRGQKGAFPTPDSVAAKPLTTGPRR